MRQPATRRFPSPWMTSTTGWKLAMIIALVGAGAGLTASGGAAAASTTSHPACGSSSPRLTVQASGQASSPPDELTISIGVSESAPTATAALAASNTQSGSLTTILRGAGVAPADITTTDFSINPDYATDGAITGYQVDNTLEVTFRNLADAGAIIDAAAGAVGNAVRINGLSFAVSNTGDIDGQARAAAIHTAAAHAKAMATAADASIHGVCSITDSTDQPYATNAAAGLPASSGPSTPVPIEAGTQQSTADVTVVYALS